MIDSALNMNQVIQIYLNRSRYLAAVPDEALSERLVHLLNNCVQLDQNSMVQLCAVENPDMFARLMDVLAETMLRHKTVTGAQSKEVWDRTRNAMIQPNAETAEKAKRLKSMILDEQSQLLFRFSKFQHMEELVNLGGLLFQQASIFKNEENLSVRDNELSLELHRFITEQEAASLPELPELPAVQGCARQLSITLECPDFLTLCLTDAVNFRMISDWKAEAAVIIHDPPEFRRRLAEGTRHLLGLNEEGKLEWGKVNYIDPYFQVSSKDVAFCKHFKFAYQREFRFVIRNSEPLEPEQRKVFLGPLADIATLVDLR